MMKEINTKIFWAWSKQMQRKALVIETLEGIGLQHLEVLNVKNGSEKNMKRRTVIVDTLDIINGALQKIIIHIRYGLPNWQDMMEIAFKPGSDYDIKIIMYDTSGSADTDIDYKKAIAAGFAKINNQNGMKIYLLGIELIINGEVDVDFDDDVDDENNVDVSIGFDIIQKPSVVNLCNPQESPSIEDFNRAEYWVQYHYNVSSLHYQIAGAPEIWLKYQIYEEIQNIGFLVYWTEDGFFLDLMGQSEDAKNFIESKCLADLTKIEDYFLNKELIPAAHADEPSILRFQILDMPYQNFYALSHSQKEDIAYQIYVNLSTIQGLFYEEEL